MSKHMNRRRFLKQTAAGAGLVILSGSASVRAYAANEKLNTAVVGCSGQGKTHLGPAAGENLVALCDIDDQRLAAAANRFPNAKTYNDYHRLYDAHKDLDAVFVATPDHSHFPAAMRAIALGAGVYVEKPLTYCIWEARTLTAFARKKKVATQMGNQAHSSKGIRLLCEFIWDDAIGPVREAHVWTDRPGNRWPQGIDRPAGTPPVPPHIHWDLWLGLAPERPYHPVYHPFKWRGWQDFGTGALGDMGCHIMDAAFWALKLADAKTLTVEAETSAVNNETYPNWSIVTYTFPARGDMPPCKLIWYDGGKMPPRPEELGPEQALPTNGSIFIGDKGTILLAHGSGPRLIPESRMQEYKRPEKTLPRSKHGHHGDFLHACKGGEPASANFDYSGPLAEVVLLGNVAVRLGEKITYDVKNMKAVNCPKAEPLIHRPYRKGWDL